MKYRDCKTYVRNDEGELESVTNIIYNGDTTIVFGECAPDQNVIRRVYDLGEKLTKIDNPIYMYRCTKGVARLAPGDTYDKNIGIKIASRKAELKGRTSVIKTYKSLISELEAVIEDMKQEIEQGENRIAAIKKELGGGAQ